MEKRKTKGLLVKIVLAILLCFACTFSFFGCGLSFDAPTGGGSTGGSGSGGSGSGSGSSSGSGSGGAGGTGSGGSSSYVPYSDYFAGAIGVYEIGADELAFYDKYISSTNLTSFYTIADRQFTTLSNVVFDTLNRVYGDNESVASKASISGYSKPQDISYNFSDIISYELQSSLSGISGTTITNGEYINYANAINGGYTIMDDGSYDTTTIVTGNAWVIGADKFSKDFIKKCLCYIYANPRQVEDTIIRGGYNLLSDSSLASYYKTFLDSNTENINNFDVKTLQTTGLTEQYMWNVLYFLGYSVIGETNLVNSINNPSNATDNYDKIFTVSGQNVSVNAFDVANKLAYQNYKGYDEVLYCIISNITNMSVGANLSVAYTPYFDEIGNLAVTIEGNNLVKESTTLFPTIKREMLIFYDDVESIAEADFDVNDDDKFIAGTARRLKSLLLIPNTSEGVDVSGLLFAVQSQEDQEYMVDITWEALYDGDTEYTQGEMFVEGDNIQSNKIVFDSECSIGDDTTDVVFNVDPEDKLKVCTLENGVSISDMISKTFNIKDVEITYENNTKSTKKLGYMNTYNYFYSVGGKWSFISNIFICNFNYYNLSGAPVEIPLTYQNFLYPYNN